MPVSYAFFDEPPLIYIRYSGHVTAEEIKDVVHRFAKEPFHAPNQPHLIDLSSVDSYGTDYAEYFSLHALLLDLYPKKNGEQFMVFHAPPGVPAELGALLSKPWDSTDHVLLRLAETREQAFDILGGMRRDVATYIQDLETTS